MTRARHHRRGAGRDRARHHARSRSTASPNRTPRQLRADRLRLGVPEARTTRRLPRRAARTRWPMGFYRPATLVKDAQRHGVEVLPIDVARSDWRATLEPCRTSHAASSAPAGAPRPALRRRAARRGAARAHRRRARGARPSRHVADLARARRRCTATSSRRSPSSARSRRSTRRRATRRAALWQVAGARARSALALRRRRRRRTSASPLRRDDAARGDARRLPRAAASRPART